MHTQPTDSKQKMPKWPIYVLVLVILFFCIANPICRFLYTMDFIDRSDQQLALLLAGDLEELDLQDSKKAFVFLGSLEEQTNASCIDLTTDDKFIYSIFDSKDTKDLSALEASIKITDYLNTQGFNITPITSDLYNTYEQEILDALPIPKSFPWYDAIVETEHFILVQLSETES
ncbi:MAG: hypothetical protein R3Y47_10160 [Lachnospiraceae bacterium]